MSGTFYAIANEPSHATQPYTRTLLAGAALARQYF